MTASEEAGRVQGPPRYGSLYGAIAVLALGHPGGSAAVSESAQRRVIRAMRWGLVPSWARDAQKLPNLFNARVETAFEKPSFRSAVKRRHCVIPMDGWYEWVPGEPTSSGGRAGPKQPFHMSMPGGQGLLMAGLWEARRDPEDESITQLSCTILTTEALGPLRRVHERMPLVVSPDVLGDWLDPDVTEENIAEFCELFPDAVRGRGRVMQRRALAEVFEEQLRSLQQPGVASTG